jgi:hypothetical protein
MIFFSPTRKIQGHDLKTVHDRFLSHPFQFIVHRCIIRYGYLICYVTQNGRHLRLTWTTSVYLIHRWLSQSDGPSYITLHYIILHYITLHYVTYIWKLPCLISSGIPIFRQYFQAKILYIWDHQSCPSSVSVTNTSLSGTKCLVRGVTFLLELQLLCGGISSWNCITWNVMTGEYELEMLRKDIAVIRYEVLL